jgi:DNA mismatch repair protein MutS2
LISQKLGVPESVVSRAMALTSDDSKSFEAVIEKLEIARVAMEKEKEEATRLRKEFEIFKNKAEAELKDKLGRAQKESDELLRRAQQTISGARASAELIFDKLEKLQKDSSNYNEKKKSIREKLYEADDIYNPVEEIDENYVLPRPLVKGDAVILRNIGTEAVLLENPDKNGNVLVKSGIAQTKTNVKNLMLVTEKREVKQAPIAKTRNTVSSTFSISLDVRGKNIEEAWIDVDKYLDEAILHGVKSTTIVHGKGTGALRKGLWEFFRKDKRIKKYRNGEYGEGDFGVTVVELK